ncbi:MAG: exodeoxyribonuclease V subunit alpha [Spirochaetota bacterium]
MTRASDIVKELDINNPALFTELDRQFADFMQRLSGDSSPELVLAVRIASNQIGKGSICVHIPSVADKDINDILGEDTGVKNFILFGKDKWLSKLNDSPVVGKPGDFKPLILDDNGRLYLYRYWQYEQKIAENIKARLEQDIDIDIEVLKSSFAKLFKSNEDDIEQSIAAIGAALHGFCVISGGPGTGKTSTVIKILALLIENAKTEKLRIALAAPTGKAAARLNEAIKKARESLDLSNTIKGSIPDESFTIHRLLGAIHGSPYFRHNAQNQLAYDVVVVDESSMADIALTAKLFEAVPVASRLILLGDRDQLSSVEAGAVLGDICDTGNTQGYSKKFADRLKLIISADISGKISISKRDEPPIADSVLTLSKSYRFTQKSGIGQLSSAIRHGEADRAVELLQSKSFDDAVLIGNKPGISLASSLSAMLIDGFGSYINTKTPDEALRLFPEFTILCALRKGDFGVGQVNMLAEEVLTRQGLISTGTRWYNKRPVMITQNDYSIRLFNGDTGIMFTDAEDGIMRFSTQSADGSIRKILPLKLPEHETAFAITVHKSQGSEFDNVLLILPNYAGPVLTRELLYTAVTRARKKIQIYGNPDTLRYMINNPAARISGLRDALWKNTR